MLNRGGYTIVGLKNWFDDMAEEPKNLGGRPSMFTEENKQLIYEFVKKGATYALCARRIGVNEKTLYDWLKQGREARDIQDRELTEKEKEFVTFCNTVERLDSEYLASLVEDVGKSNKQWMLTKRMKGEFGDETNINLKADVRTELSWKDLIENVKKEG